MAETTEHVDVLIIGAGLSGIGAAAHLVRECPDKKYAVLEAREAIGGTWDLFRYPGIRSDSDMFTFGYSFKPWKDAKAISDGAAIRRYVEETADEYGVTRHIRFGHRVLSASWSTADGRWTVTAERTDTAQTVVFTASWVMGATGYYSYDEGYRPSFDGEQDFAGEVIHPQDWPEDLDYSGRRIAVIGSGATAVTLVPNLAETAEHVTMVQRTPTYIASVPAVDSAAKVLRRILPDSLSYSILRWKNMLSLQLKYSMSRRRPNLVRSKIRKETIRRLPAGFDVDTHFNPPYDPWDQRLCAVPDGDLFEALSAGSASISTGSIRRFTENGVELDSGEQVDADIIVTATGLNLRWLGGMEVIVDGESVTLGDRFAYKGMMISGVPNLSMVTGYTNNSWTLKADLVSRYACRLLRHLDDNGYESATPRTPVGESSKPFLDLDAGYTEVCPRWPNRARICRGDCTRTTSRTSECSAAATSMTESWSSAAGNLRADRRRSWYRPMGCAHPPRNRCRWRGGRCATAMRERAPQWSWCTASAAASRIGWNSTNCSTGVDSDSSA